ncbi:hypothetical protein PoB_000341900 [Plakobranchus ocellatus]|uniref:Uncharacterized protein n=1 Tax=Plakobranchus ocellatus TaxID=259542 RepID=A0AAV3Y4C9_9GAST|nr:hypothetical protein PoB_000341900 [Plakobranchus ocellatus]
MICSTELLSPSAVGIMAQASTTNDGEDGSDDDEYWALQRSVLHFLLKSTGVIDQVSEEQAEDKSPTKKIISNEQRC